MSCKLGYTLRVSFEAGMARWDKFVIDEEGKIVDARKVRPADSVQLALQALSAQEV
jgi:peroxiredoxin